MLTSLPRKRKIEPSEEQNQSQVRKMARLEEIKSVQNDSTEVANKEKNESTEVVFAKFTLNDLDALEKKFAMCNVTPIKVSKEAKDGSSIHVDFKTSLFKVVKCN